MEGKSGWKERGEVESSRAEECVEASRQERLRELEWREGDRRCGEKWNGGKEAEEVERSRVEESVEGSRRNGEN